MALHMLDSARSPVEALSDLREKYETARLTALQRSTLAGMILELEDFCRLYRPAETRR
jgi:hypothetical protein